MPLEQMNISLPPKMARFIRGKVKDGNYTNASEVVRDALRHMQETETAKNERALLTDFESRLPIAERSNIARRVNQGIKDIEAGRFEEYSVDGLRQFGRGLVSDAVRKQGTRAKA